MFSRIFARCLALSLLSGVLAGPALAQPPMPGAVAAPPAGQMPAMQMPFGRKNIGPIRNPRLKRYYGIVKAQTLEGQCRTLHRKQRRQIDEDLRPVRDKLSREAGAMRVYQLELHAIETSINRMKKGATCGKVKPEIDASLGDIAALRRELGIPRN